MCTAITFKNKTSYFGRNMDIGYYFGERVVIIPRNFTLKLKKEEPIKQHYAIIGMASVFANTPLFAEGINEQGLGVAGLNFPRYAQYNENSISECINLAPYEIITYILAKCATVDEAVSYLEKINLVAIPFQEGLPLPTLHWMIADKERSIVFEVTKNGAKIHENPVGVMTNNPTFDFHITNLSNYIQLTPYEYEETVFSNFAIKPLGHGSGSLGIPGDSTTTSRFVRAVFVKSTSKCEASESANLSQFFHILGSVSVPRGFACGADEISDYTTYSSCANLNDGIYYYKTYENSQITAVNLYAIDLDGTELVEYPLITSQQILSQN